MKRVSARNSIVYGLIVILLGTLIMFFVSTRPASSPEVMREPVGNFDAETQTMIASANRVVFLIPFSHWDTDWHQDFGAYSKLADQNILKAIELAKKNSRYRFTLEQVLFVQHFWDTHPDSRADLITLVKKRQITFAWAGILPGAIALGIYTLGILGRLMAEVIESLDERPLIALRSCGASGAQIFFYGILPRAMPLFLSNILYRWEVSVRETVIIGVVGAAGLGRVLAEQLSNFDYAGITTTLLFFIALTVFADVHCNNRILLCTATFMSP